MPYTSAELALPISDGTDFYRVDLRFLDVDHSGESFEGRVFFNNPGAGIGTPLDASDGYAGSLYVFAHPHCWGDEGHCSVPPGPLHGFDDRAPHHLVPQIHELEVTDTVRALIAAGARTASATVLPIVRRDGEEQLDEAQLRFSELQLVSYE